MTTINDSSETVAVFGIVRRTENGVVGYLTPRKSWCSNPVWSLDYRDAKRFERQSLGSFGWCSVTHTDDWTDGGFQHNSYNGMAFANRTYTLADFQSDGNREAIKLGGAFADFVILRETEATKTETLAKPAKRKPRK